MHDRTAGTGELRRHWRVLAGSTLGFAVGVHSLPFYTAGLFIAALHLEFGWSRAALSLGPTCLVAALGLTSPIAGILADRFGERRLIIPGLGLLVLMLVALSRIDGLAAYLALMAGMAILAVGSATPSYVRIISRHFDRRRGTALGIAITGSAVASTIAPFALQNVIDDHGWRTAYIILAAVIAASIPLIFLLLRTDNRRLESPATNPARVGTGELVRDPVFRTLALALFAASLAAPGLIIHFVPMLIDHGMSATQAAGYAGLIGAVLLVSRLATGVLVDRFFAPLVGMIVMVLSAAGFALFAIGGPQFAIIGAIATGISFGAESDLMGYLAGRYFRIAVFGRIFGILYAIYLAGTAMSPMLYGITADLTGSYDAALLGAAALLMLSAWLFSRLPDYRTD